MGAIQRVSLLSEVCTRYMTGSCSISDAYGAPVNVCTIRKPKPPPRIGLKAAGPSKDHWKNDQDDRACNIERALMPTATHKISLACCLETSALNAPRCAKCR
eukprot:6188365-Pleurochrysis_carterae.AAC.1